MKIHYVDWGVGYVLNREIYLNKALRGHPDVHAEVLDHELKHVRGEKHVDWNERFSWDYYRFILTHPRTWIQFFPVMIHGRTISYDLSVFTVWMVVLTTAMIIYSVIRWMI